MNILLINPLWIKREGNIWKKVASCMPPLGLAYIASFLESKNVAVKILDLQVEPQAILEELKQEGRSPSFIGITATTSIIDSALEVAKTCRKLFPRSKIVMGGVHPTILAEETLVYDYVDYIVRREGEITLWELAASKEEEGILGLSFKKDGKYIHNPDRPFIEQIDNLPPPAYHLLPIRMYHPALGGYKRLPAVSMIVTRGCPGKCTFCYGDFLGSKIRMHSARYIIDEINMLKKNFGIKEISFYDDTFTTFKNKVQEVCSLIIRENIDITWSCFSRIDFVDEKTLSLMKRAGCHQICFGVESGSEDILKNIKKMVSLDKVKNIIPMTKKAGIEARATFMLGNTGETEETMEKTIELAVSLNPDIALFNITTPYPGTEMYKWADENGYLKTKDWAKYDLSHTVMSLPTVDDNSVEEYYRKAYKLFYKRPVYLLKRLLKIRTTTDIKTALKAIPAVFFNTIIQKKGKV